MLINDGDCVLVETPGYAFVIFTLMLDAGLNRDYLAEHWVFLHLIRAHLSVRLISDFHLDSRLIIS
jgi:hypothetical protein